MKKNKRKNITMLIIITLFIPIITVLLYLKFDPIFGKSPNIKKSQKILHSTNFKNGRFHNLYPTEVMTKPKENIEDKMSFFEMFFPPKGRIPDKALPSKKLNKDDIIKNSFTWLGHSSILIKNNSKTMLIDPVFHIASPMPIFGKPFETIQPILQDDLPKIDFILITHNHYDHLDYKAIKKFNNSIEKYLIPLGLKETFVRWGIDENRIVEFDWYDEISIDDTKFIFTPSRHFSGRTFSDRAKTLWGGWIISSSDQKIFISGDGGYSPEFKKIGEKYGPFDISFLECGAYNQGWAQIHMFPDQVVQTAIDINSHLTVPIHWGKFNLAPHKWLDPIKKFTKTANEQNVNYATPLMGEPFTLKNIPKEKWWELD